MSYPAISEPSQYSWTGFHLGISGGYGFNADDPSYSYENVPTDVLSLLHNTTHLDADGGLIGGSIGFDKQFGQFVLGIEGDISATDFGENAIHNLAGDPNIGFPPHVLIGGQHHILLRVCRLDCDVAQVVVERYFCEGHSTHQGTGSPARAGLFFLRLPST